MKTFLAGGTINPFRFVKRSTAADHTVLQADLNAFPCGISAQHGIDAPIPSITDNPIPAARTGDQMNVHTPFGGSEQDSTVLLELGGTVTRGARLMPDANGKGITATTGKYFGAIADESGVSGERILVTPCIGSEI